MHDPNADAILSDIEDAGFTVSRAKTIDATGTVYRLAAWKTAGSHLALWDADGVRIQSKRRAGSKRPRRSLGRWASRPPTPRAGFSQVHDSGQNSQHHGRRSHRRAQCQQGYSVSIGGQSADLRFAPEQIEPVDYAPGTATRIGNTRLVREASGS